MTILLTGAGGVLGVGLAGAFEADQMLVVGREPVDAFQAAQFLTLDLEQPDDLARLIARVRPSVVLHAAAIGRLEICERDPEYAERINTRAACEAASGAAAVGAFAIFISTDQVFDGEGERYREEDPPAPLHVYGKTKAEAERLTLLAGGAVARLPLLLGPGPPPARGRPNRSQGADAGLLAALAAGERPYLYTDEVRTPVAAALAAHGLRALADARRPGIFHFSGAEAVSRAELGRRVCEAAAVEPAFDEGPAPRGELEQPRPRRLVLDCGRTERELGWQPPDLRQSLARWASEMDS